MKLPSKELLSEVLHMKLELGDINRYYLIKDERHLLRLILTDKTDCWNYDINIYELAHECKEWAYKNNFDIWSSNLNICECSNNKTFNGIERFIADTEPEAVFKACEWIIEQTKCGS